MLGSRIAVMRVPRFADLRIGVRLGLGLALLTGLLFVVVLFGIRTMAGMHGQLSQVLTVSNARIWHANSIREAAHNAERSLLVMTVPGLAGQRDFARIRLLSAWASLRHSLAELQMQETSPRGQELLLKLRQAAEGASREGDTLLAHGQLGTTGTLSAERLQAIHTPLLQLQDICAELVAYERDEIDRLHREASQGYVFTRNAFLGLSGLVLVAAVVVGIRLTRSIVRPLRVGVETANALASGDLGVEIAAGHRDEAGELLGAMRDMAARLRKARDLEAQLLQAQKLETVGLLAGGVAHDFNNILTVIAGQAQLGMLKTTERDGNHGRFLIIDQAGQRAAALIRQLLAFSRKQQLAPGR
jgi:HAMP domain-containing protein